MMGDLVIVDIVDVDALCPFSHLLRHYRCVQVALQDVAGCAQSSKRPSAMHAWQDVKAVLPGGLPALFRKLRDRSYHPSGEAVRTGQEPGKGLSHSC
jgi:hypothetical protein